MAEFIEGAEDLGELEEVGNLGEDMGDADEDLNEAETKEFNDLQEETESFYETAEQPPESVPEQVEKLTEDSDVQQSVEPDSEETAELEKEGVDPKEAENSLKTRLSKVWDQYGDFLKSFGKFAVEAVGSYFKWKMIFDGVGLVQKDFVELLEVLNHVPLDGLSPEQKQSIERVKAFLRIGLGLNDVMSKVGKQLQVSTAAGMSSKGVGELMMNFFTGSEVRDIAESAAAILKQMSVVHTHYSNELSQLGLGKSDPKPQSAADWAKVGAKLSSVDPKLKAADIAHLKTAYTAYAGNVTDTLAKTAPGMDPDQRTQVKAALVVPDKFGKTLDKAAQLLQKPSRH